jgi:hypothetical protein
MPPFPLVQDVLLHVILPAAGIAFAVLVLLKSIAGKAVSGPGAAVGLAGGFCLANHLRGLLPWLPDGYDWHWLLWLGLAALVAGTVANLPGRSRVGLWLAALVGSGLWVLTPAELRTAPWWSVPVFASVVFGTWAAADEQANRLGGPAVPLWLALTCLAAAIVVIHAGIARFMDLALVLASALSAIALASCWRAGNTGSVAGCACLVVAGLMLAGWQESYSAVPPASFALVAGAPLTLSLTLIGPLSRLSPWPRFALQTVILLIPLATAVILAARAETLAF